MDTANGKLQMPVTYTGVSVGKEQVSIGLTIDHSHVSRETMGETFVCRQLDCECLTGQPGEQSLPGIESDRVSFSGDFTANGYSERKAGYGTRLAIPKSELDPDDLWDLSGKAGTLIVHGSDPLRENGDGGTAAHEPLPGQRELPEGDDEDKGLSDDELRELGRDGYDDPEPITAPLDASNAIAIGEEEEIKIAIPANKKHTAEVYVQQCEGGYWRAGWQWDSRDIDAGADDNGEGPVLNTREDALDAAYFGLLASMADIEMPESKAGQNRRKSVIKLVEQARSDARSSGKTILDTHPA